MTAGSTTSGPTATLACTLIRRLRTPLSSPANNQEDR
jgi:hypothetical protein